VHQAAGAERDRRHGQVEHATDGHGWTQIRQRRLIHRLRRFRRLENLQGTSESVAAAPIVSPALPLRLCGSA
jgi:hypothetical protein